MCIRDRTLEVITATDLELRAGSRLLLSSASVRVAPGDRIGLVGRNGAGKTTLTRVLAGEAAPAAGTVTRTGSIGYLPQDPRTGDLDLLARDRVLSARGLDEVTAQLHAAAGEMASVVADTRDAAVRRYGRLEDRFHVLGGYAAEAEAASIASSLGLPDRALTQPLGTLSGGQRRRVELARILFSGAETLLLDEPTNHLDADSVAWLREFLRSHRGGLVVISHDVDLLERTVNRVLHLDANRAELDGYNVGWRAYLTQRETDERRRRRERSNAERQAAALQSQADRMRAKATKAKAAQGMARRAERLLAGLEEVRQVDRVARLRFPEPAPCGRTPLTATGLSKSYGTVTPGHGLRLGYYAQEHETLDTSRNVLENMRAAAPDTPDGELRRACSPARCARCPGSRAPARSNPTAGHGRASPCRCPASRYPPGVVAGWSCPRRSSRG